MPPEGIDSLNADNLKSLVLSLLGRIDELSEQNKKLLEQISALLARIAELEARAGEPPKTPTAIKSGARKNTKCPVSRKAASISLTDH
jgi:hypothetical protein